MPTAFTKRRNNTASLLAAITLTAIGALLVLGIFKQLRSPNTTELTIELSLKGTDDRPISGSEIWLVRPTTEFLGTTNKRGLARLKSQVPRGRAAVVEARGASFRARREILIPNVRNYETRVAINPAEASDGRVEIMSLSMEEQKTRAIGKYTDAVAAKSAERKKSIRKVIVQINDQQPPLQPFESDYLSRVKERTERTVRSLQYSLLSRKVTTVSIRLLRTQELFVEFKLLGPSGEFLGARLVDTKSLTPQLIQSIITEAINPLYAAMRWPAGPDMRQALTQSIRIRKRPVDDITVYFNGHVLPKRESRDRLIALFPRFPARPGTAHLAAVSSGGVLVAKKISVPPPILPILWNWPEWSIAQSGTKPPP